MDILDTFDIDELYDDPGSNAEPIEPHEWDLELEPEILPQPEPEGSLSSSEEATEHANVREVVLLMKRLSLRLDTFLSSLFYGNKLCVSDPILRGARGQVTQSKLLHAILNNIHTPSRYTGSRPQGASESMDRWAWRHVSQLARSELNQLAENARINRLDDDTNSFPDLEYIKFNSLKERVMSFTPQLAKFLTLAGETKPHGRTRRKQGEAGYEFVENSFAAVMNVYALASQYAPRCNRLQKHLSLYFRAKHAPKSLYPLFNKCGYTTSYSWSNDAITDLANDAMAKMVATVEASGIFWIYDNLRLPSPIKAQRGDRHTVTDNGTAMTIVQLPDSIKDLFLKKDCVDPEILPVDSDPTPPKNLSWNDFFDPERFQRLAASETSLILEILFETVPGLSDVEARCDEKLAPPEPTSVMQAGKEHKTKFFMLGTVPIDETSVGGNMQVVAEMARQTGLDSEISQKMLALGRRIIPIVGDQMTTARLRTLRSLRSRDPNGYERMSWAIITPGWFHILLNLGMTIFDAHRGSDRTMTFYKDLSLLGRSGLSMDMRKKRPSFFTNDEFLRHKLFGLVRSLWMYYSETNTTQELVRWVKSTSAETLSKIAQKIYYERVSSSAVEDLKSLPEFDQILCNTIYQTRDLLLYYSVRRAIQSGNVGWLEDLLPNLIVYFKGRKNHNYAQELAETMHWMLHIATPEMRAAVREHVWLVNTSGRSNGFYECDRLQEFNNDKQKRFGPPPQTTSWESHKAIAPAIPVLGEIAESIEDNLFDFQRSRVHMEKSAELDIDRLAIRHVKSSIHVYSAGREIEHKSDMSKDYVQIGTRELMDDKWFESLAANRDIYDSIKSTEQTFSLVAHATENQADISTDKTEDMASEIYRLSEDVDMSSVHGSRTEEVGLLTFI